ncbi:MAG: ATP synthase F0 subunit B [Desulfobacterium sp.]|nr:ATP synthase F0 subunit B [Desulfobacterium sp.]MBU3949139.1 ATP synthase F0 subunit B [Pseudomonadota bacterium]MBU4011013.1 ATP synthase F0 subunit B [Pseudomonadota bacterium]
MINVDISVITQIVNFLFIIWAMNIVLYKPIRKILIERKEKINGLEQGIDKINKSIQEKEDSYALGIKNARSEGQKEKEALLSVAQNEEQQLIDKINKKAQEDLAQMRGKIVKDTESVRKLLLNEVDACADAVCQKILGRVV